MQQQKPIITVRNFKKWVWHVLVNNIIGNTNKKKGNIIPPQLIVQNYDKYFNNLNCPLSVFSFQTKTPTSISTLNSNNMMLSHYYGLAILMENTIVCSFFSIKVLSVE